MARKKLQQGPTLDDLFKATQSYKQAHESASRAMDKSDKLRKKLDQMLRETQLSNVLYTDGTGTSWFFDGWNFTQVNG